MEGSSPTIVLGLDALPRITGYVWTKDGVMITSDNKLTVDTNSLKFNMITRDYAGLYSVTVQDSVGIGTASVSLNVYCK